MSVLYEKIRDELRFYVNSNNNNNENNSKLIAN